MVDPAVWKNSLALAKAGDADALNRVAALLLHWTRGEMPASIGPDDEDMAVAFVLRMMRDRLAHLLDLPPARLDAFLRRCWQRFVINWRAAEQRRRAWQILWADWARREGEEGKGAGLEAIAAPGPGPEEIVVNSMEIAAARAEIARLGSRKRQVLTLLVDEELPETEIADRLRMNASTVRWCIHSAREHMRKWRKAGEA